MTRSHDARLPARTRVQAALAAVLLTTFAAPSIVVAQNDRDPTVETGPVSVYSASLYERLGGYDAIASFVGLVFPRVAAHPDLAHLFRGHGLDSQQRQFQLVVEMVCRATGGPCIYIGRGMEPVHDGLGITDEMWEVFMRVIDEGIREVGIPSAEARAFREVWVAFRPGVVRPDPR